MAAPWAISTSGAPPRRRRGAVVPSNRSGTPDRCHTGASIVKVRAGLAAAQPRWAVVDADPDPEHRLVGRTPWRVGEETRPAPGVHALVRPVAWRLRAGQSADRDRLRSGAAQSRLPGGGRHRHALERLRRLHRRCARPALWRGRGRQPGHARRFSPLGRPAAVSHPGCTSSAPRRAHRDAGTVARPRRALVLSLRASRGVRFAGRPRPPVGERRQGSHAGQRRAALPVLPTRRPSRAPVAAAHCDRAAAVCRLAVVAERRLPALQPAAIGAGWRRGRCRPVAHSCACADRVALPRRHRTRRRPPLMERRRDWLAVLSCLAGSAWFVTIWRLTAYGTGNWNLQMHYVPSMLYAARELADGGRGLLWNPFQNCGQPFFAISGTGPLYPLNWFFFFLSSTYALYAVTALNLAIGGVGAFALGREIGVSRVAAVCGAITFQLGNASLDVNSWSPMYGSPYAWMPVALWCCERILREPSTRKGWALALAMTLALLPGSPQILLYTYQLIALRVVWELMTSRTARSLATLRAIAIGLFLPPLLAAVHLLPSLEMAAASVRNRPLS